LSTAASAPVASECTPPEQFAEPAAHRTEPDASDTLSNPPNTAGFAALPVAASVPVPVLVLVNSAACTGWVNTVAEFDCDWQPPPVAVQSDEPVEVFAAAADAAPVIGLTVTSPEPVDDVFDEPVPEQSVWPLWQVVELDAPLDPVVPEPVPNRPHSDCRGFDATEPD